jgi:hypothetical protein
MKYWADSKLKYNNRQSECSANAQLLTTLPPSSALKPYYIGQLATAVLHHSGHGSRAASINQHYQLEIEPQPGC